MNLTAEQRATLGELLQLIEWERENGILPEKTLVNYRAMLRDMLAEAEGKL